MKKEDLEVTIEILHSAILKHGEMKTNYSIKGKHIEAREQSRIIARIVDRYNDMQNLYFQNFETFYSPKVNNN